MYQCRPTHQNALAKIVAVLLFATSMALLFCSSLPPSSVVVTLMQCVGLALLIPAVQILTRYVVLQYLYRLQSYEDGNTDLEIYTYRGGSKMQLVCRIGVEEITAMAPLSAENKKPTGRMKRYRYLPDLSPAVATVLSITNADGDCELIFCPDERMLAMLRDMTKKPQDPAPSID